MKKKASPTQTISSYIDINVFVICLCTIFFFFLGGWGVGRAGATSCEKSVPSLLHGKAIYWGRRCCLGNKLTKFSCLTLFTSSFLSPCFLLLPLFSFLMHSSFIFVTLPSLFHPFLTSLLRVLICCCFLPSQCLWLLCVSHPLISPSFTFITVTSVPTSRCPWVVITILVLFGLLYSPGRPRDPRGSVIDPGV